MATFSNLEESDRPCLNPVEDNLFRIATNNLNSVAIDKGS